MNSLIKTTKNTIKTTCCYCGVGCGILVDYHAGKVKVRGDEDHPSSRGMLCSKGLNLHHTANDRSDRLKFPMIRDNSDGRLKDVTWEQAMEKICQTVRETIRKYGADSFGFYVSGQCLTEEYYLVNKLARGFIGTNNIDSNSRLCMSSAVTAYKMALGEDTVPGCYDDIESADCILIAGANMAWCHPVLFRRIEEHKKKNPGLSLIVIDPRKTQTAEIADVHLSIFPGTDVILFNGIAAELIRNGLIDDSFVENHTQGFDALKEHLKDYTLHDTAIRCGIPIAKLIRTIRAIGNASGFLSFWSMGLNQSAAGVNKNLAFLNLSLLTGKIGIPGSGPFSLTGQPNAMGGRETGGLSTLLPAHKNPANPEDRKQIADYWGVKNLPENPGLTATEMFEAMEKKKLKVLWVVNTNPSVSAPDLRRFEKSLNNLDLLIVQDCSDRSDTLRHAHVVLPSATWLEKSGVMTNSERRISYLPAILEPPGEALPDAEIFLKFAFAMGWEKQFDYEDLPEVYREYVGLTRETGIDVSGLSHERLKNEGTFQWPVNQENPEGTKRMFSDHHFPTPGGKAILHAVSDENPSEKTCPEFPLVLMTGRLRDQWHTMTRTGKVTKLTEHSPRPLLEMHPDDASARSIQDGNPVSISNKRGRGIFRVRVTDSVLPGTVFLPMHWGKSAGTESSCVNNLTSWLIDPVSKEPDFNYSPVSVFPYMKPTEKIIVIGAGSAAADFIQSYRSGRNFDEITVFGDEESMFLNRNLLNEFIAGNIKWEETICLDPAKIKEWGIQKHKTPVTKISREEKTVVDATGKIHPYDRLILATGCRRPIPTDIEEIQDYVILKTRDKKEAEKARANIEKGGHLVIYGDDIFGLELACALQYREDLDITVITDKRFLMEKVVDKEASEILSDRVGKGNIRILSGAKAERFERKGEKALVELNNGQRIRFDMILFNPTGIPDTSLAKASGIDSEQGIRIDRFLRTNDESIFAIGEVSEFEKTLVSSKEVIHEQSSELAGYLLGDRISNYRGTIPVFNLIVQGWEMTAIGFVGAEEGETDAEIIRFSDRTRHVYKKCVVRDNKLVGALLLGRQKDREHLKALIQKGVELDEQRSEIMTGDGTFGVSLPKGRIVCSCHGIGEQNLREAIKDCKSIPEFYRATPAGSKCGSCRPELASLWKMYGTKPA